MNAEFDISSNSKLSSSPNILVLIVTVWPPSAIAIVSYNKSNIINTANFIYLPHSFLLCIDISKSLQILHTQKYHHIEIDLMLPC